MKQSEWFRRRNFTPNSSCPHHMKTAILKDNNNIKEVQYRCSLTNDFCRPERCVIELGLREYDKTTFGGVCGE